MFSKKLLIVDDEKEVRDILSEFFVRAGYLVETAVSGKAALKKLDSFIPNLVLLDYMMPGRTGLEIYPQLKKVFPYIRVIILTGRGSEEIAVQSLKMGVDDYITKPFDLKKGQGSGPALPPGTAG